MKILKSYEFKKISLKNFKIKNRYIQIFKKFVKIQNFHFPGLPASNNGLHKKQLQHHRRCGQWIDPHTAFRRFLSFLHM